MEDAEVRGRRCSPRTRQPGARAWLLDRGDRTRDSLEAVPAVNAADVKRKARELGFDLCGVAPAADLPELGFLREWLDRGFGATMTYLHRTARRRADVRHVVPSAQT